MLSSLPTFVIAAVVVAAAAADAATAGTFHSLTSTFVTCPGRIALAPVPKTHVTVSVCVCVCMTDTKRVNTKIN